ncbi:MAG: caspase family protein [Candidatus Cloacimonetes bacterium]|nr:caspase family protein [Candidatus Cloacimonadota bacterium]
MKKIFAGLLFLMVLLVFFSCSQQGELTDPGTDQLDGSIYQRPEFIETRTDAEIERYLLKASDSYTPERKKPQPPNPPDPPEDPNPNPAHKYAYIVGISDYDGTQNDLQYCDDDAQDWKNYLQTQGFTIQFDIDQNATASAIESGLQWLMTSAAPGDEIAFIYSGHGVDYAQYGTCIISCDLYYITHSFVMEYLSLSNCTKKMVAIDCCYAGDFLGDSETGMIVATASTNSYSYDGDETMQNGVWTYYYMVALVDNEVIFNEDAAGYAKTQMKAWGRTYHVRVTPAVNDDYDGYFDI